MTRVFIVLLCWVISIVQAFIVSPQSSFVRKTELFVKQQGKPAASREQDLEWTRNVILKHIGQVEDTVISDPEVATARRSDVNVVVDVVESSTKQQESSSKEKLRKRDRFAKAIQKLKPF